MQNNRSPLWALGGAAVGFAMPFLGLACIAAVCLFSLVGASGLASTGASQSEAHISGPLSGPAVAVIDINGEIVSGSSGTIGLGSSYAVSGDIIPLVRQAAADSEVKAILLRIDSPGGSVVASDTRSKAAVSRSWFRWASWTHPADFTSAWPPNIWSPIPTRSPVRSA